MEKNHAFLVAFLITLVVVGIYLFFNAGSAERAGLKVGDVLVFRD